MGSAFTLAGLFGLPHIHTKSGRKAIRVIGVVVVDRAVGVHIHEIVGVAGIRGTEPPINGDTGYNLITQSGAALSVFVALLDFGDLRDFVGNVTDPLFEDVRR